MVTGGRPFVQPTVLAGAVARSDHSAAILDCVAEALAPHPPIARAKERQGSRTPTENRFGGLEDDVSADSDFEFLLDESLEGVDEAGVGEDFGMTRFSMP
jgi:hypothetical protein